MDSRASLASQESKGQVKMMSRKRPLRTCAVSVLVIANKASTKVQGIHGPVDVIAKVAARFATFASPIFLLMHYQWIIMTLLSIVDRIILAVEYMIERLYPPSSIVFNMIDEFIQVVEILPEKLDQTMNNVSSSIPSLEQIMNRIPSLIPFIHQGSVWDWGLVHAITILDFVSTGLTGWRMSNGTREKEIVIDTSFNDKIKGNHHHYSNEADAAKANRAVEQLVDSSKDDAKGGEAYNIPKSNTGTPLGAVSYKEVLTKGKKEGIRGNKSRTNSMDSTTEYMYYNNEEVKSAAAKNEGNDQDEILDLFDNAWLTNRKTNHDGNSPRSLSFHGGHH